MWTIRYWSLNGATPVPTARTYGTFASMEEAELAIPEALEELPRIRPYKDWGAGVEFNPSPVQEEPARPRCKRHLRGGLGR